MQTNLLVAVLNHYQQSGKTRNIKGTGKDLAAILDPARWHRLGGTLRLASGHAFGHMWKKHKDAHPDWFALQPGGTRDQSRSPDRARLCVSNLQLIEEIAREKIERLKQAVRYAFWSNPVFNLYNREGLPASPFRTDDWPEYSRRSGRVSVAPRAACQGKWLPNLSGFGNHFQ